LAIIPVICPVSIAVLKIHTPNSDRIAVDLGAIVLV
jgi:hypothetical protein